MRPPCPRSCSSHMLRSRRPTATPGRNLHPFFIVRSKKYTIHFHACENFTLAKILRHKTLENPDISKCRCQRKLHSNVMCTKIFYLNLNTSPQPPMCPSLFYDANQLFWFYLTEYYHGVAARGAWGFNVSFRGSRSLTKLGEGAAMGMQLWFGEGRMIRG